VPTKTAGSFDVVGRKPGQARAKETGDAKEFRGLQIDDTLIIRPGDVRRTAPKGLHDFPGAHAAG
jgi:hypothetical protein